MQIQATFFAKGLRPTLLVVNKPPSLRARSVSLPINNDRVKLYFCKKVALKFAYVQFL
jgi:hypothetical protein